MERGVIFVKNITTNVRNIVFKVNFFIDEKISIPMNMSMTSFFEAILFFDTR